GEEAKPRDIKNIGDRVPSGEFDHMACRGCLDCEHGCAGAGEPQAPGLHQPDSIANARHERREEDTAVWTEDSKEDIAMPRIYRGGNLSGLLFDDEWRRQSREGRYS